MSARPGGNSEWVSIAKAFEELGLDLAEADDRQVWQYFVSALVQLAVSDGSGGWLRLGPVPHAIGPDGLATFLLGMPSPVRSAGNPCFVCRADVERILEGKPYLFDSLAATVWKVNSRQVRQVTGGMYFKPLNSTGDDTPPFKSLRASLDMGAIAPRSLQQVYTPQQSMRQGLIASAKRTLRQYANALRSTAEAITAAQSALEKFSDTFLVLNDPWVVRYDRTDKPIVIVSPLFTVRDMNELVPRYRSPWWFEDVGDDMKQKELLADLAQLNDLGVFTEAIIKDLEESPVPSAFDPALMRKMNDPDWCRAREKMNPFLYHFFQQIEARQRAFFQAERMRNTTLNQSRCAYCGGPLAGGTKRGQGRPSIHCGQPDCHAQHAMDYERNQKAAEREWNARRDLPRTDQRN